MSSALSFESLLIHKVNDNPSRNPLICFLGLGRVYWLSWPIEMATCLSSFLDFESVTRKLSSSSPIRTVFPGNIDRNGFGGEDERALKWVRWCVGVWERENEKWIESRKERDWEMHFDFCFSFLSRIGESNFDLSIHFEFIFQSEALRRKVTGWVSK